MVVRSAGYSDGNKAEFWLMHGDKFYICSRSSRCAAGWIDSECYVPVVSAPDCLGMGAELRNGQRIYATRTRGLTIVDLWPNMTATLKINASL